LFLVFCDIILETDDGGTGGSIFANKVVWASASPYFQAMFTNFSEKNQDLVIVKELDSSALNLLINFIYFGKIIITESNVQVIMDNVFFYYSRQNYLNCFLFIYRGFVTGIKSFAIRRSKRGML